MTPHDKPLLIRALEVTDPSSSRGQLKTVRADGLRESEKRREALPPDLEARADALWPLVGKLFGHTLKSWREGFCKDYDPGREIGVWEHVVEVVDQLWVDQSRILEKLDRDRLIRLVVMVSINAVDIPSQLSGVRDEQVALVREVYNRQ